MSETTKSLKTVDISVQDWFDHWVAKHRSAFTERQLGYMAARREDLEDRLLQSDEEYWEEIIIMVYNLLN